MPGLGGRQSRRPEQLFRRQTAASGGQGVFDLRVAISLVKATQGLDHGIEDAVMSVALQHHGAVALSEGGGAVRRARRVLEQGEQLVPAALVSELTQGPHRGESHLRVDVPEPLTDLRRRFRESETAQRVDSPPARPHLSVGKKGEQAVSVLGSADLP